MNISGVSASQGGRSYPEAANNGKNASKIEDEIKELKQKIKDVDNSFDSPKAKKEKKQLLEAQVQKKQAELQQAQSKANNNSTNNATGAANDDSNTNNVQSPDEESSITSGVIDIKI